MVLWVWYFHIQLRSGKRLLTTNDVRMRSGPQLQYLESPPSCTCRLVRVISVP